MKKSSIWIGLSVIILLALYGYRLYYINKDYTINPGKVEYSIKEAVMTGGLVTTLHSVDVSKNVEGLAPSSGNKFAIIDVTLKNIGNKPLKDVLSQFMLYHKFDTYIYDLDAQILLKSQGNFNKTSTIQPGEIINGKLVFQIPDNTKKLYFKYPAREFEGKEFNVLKETAINF